MAINKNKINDAALKFLQKGQLKKAIKEYDKILAEDPGDVRTLLKKGDLLVRANERAEAVDTYLKVANAYSQQGFHLKAVAVFKQILKLDEGRVEVNLRLAEEYQNLGITGDAMSHLQIMAAYYDQQGMVRESLDILRRMVELDPDNVASRIKLAEMYSREGMVAEAVEEFTQAADYLKNANRIEDYIKVTERLIFHDQSNLVVVKELAGIYLQRGDTKRALGKLQVCFKADPRDLDTLGMLAMSFHELSQVSKTISVYKEMAKIYHDMGAVDEMQQVYRRILEVSPDDAEARQALGLEAGAPSASPAPEGYLDPGPGALDYEQGEDGRGTEATFSPEGAEMTLPGGPAGGPAEGPHLSEADREAISRLLTETDVYIKYGLTNKAYEHLQRVFELDPHNVEAHEKLKDLYLAAGQMDHAAQELVTLTHLNLRRGRADAARIHLRALLGLAPGHPMAAQLAAELESLAPVGEPVGEADEFGALEPGAADVLVDDGGGVVQVGAEPDGEDVPIEVPIDLIDIDVPAELEEDSGQFEAGPDEDPLSSEPEVIVLEEPPADGAGELPDFDDLDDSLLEAVSGAAGGEPASEDADLDGPALLLEDASPEDLALIATMDEEDEDESEMTTRVASREEMDLSSQAAPPPLPQEVGPSLGDEFDDYVDGEETREAEGLGFVLDATAAGLPGPEPGRTPAGDGGPGRDEELLPFAEDDDPFFQDLSEAPAEAGEAAEQPTATVDLEPDLLGEEELLEAEEPTVSGDEARTSLLLERPAALAPPPEDDFDPLAEVEAAARPLALAVPGPDDAFEEETTGPVHGLRSAPPAAPETAPEHADLEDSFEEIDFFIQQNLLDEARDGLAALHAEHPEHPGVLERLARLEPLLAGAAPAPAVAPEEVLGQFDLAQAISSEVSDETFDPSMDDEYQYSVDDVLSEFKKGVAKVVAREDSATHFDLGIAYKEMGLLDDAIGEFGLAAQDPARQAEGLTMVGLCLSEKGQFSDAINRFKDALHVPGLGEEKANGLYFEMGLVYEKLKETGEALYYFKKVYKRDPRFRDVDQRLKALRKGDGAARQAESAGEDEEEEEARPTGGAEPSGLAPEKKNKISFV